jgi:predicted phosphoribosyltransferase
MRFRDRRDAGRQLADRLAPLGDRADVTVLGLPRGGMLPAFEIAARIGAPLDVFLVRKLGVPGHPELAMGAIAEGGVQVLNDAIIAELRIPPAAIERVAARERAELERLDREYRRDRHAAPMAGRVIVLVDDGLATGATMEAAAQAVRSQHPARLVIAVPVGAAETCRRLSSVADEVVCLERPQPFEAVGAWYEDFSQATDAEVRALLQAPTAPSRE